MSGRNAMESVRTRQRFDDLVKAGKDCEEIAEAMGRSLRWAQHWRRKLYGPTARKNAVNRAEIDRLILAEKSTAEIMAELGVGKTTVLTRRAAMSKAGLIPEARRYQPKEYAHHDIADAPLIPPTDRANLARKAIEKRFATTPGWSWEVWSQGPAWQETVRMGGYL